MTYVFFIDTEIKAKKNRYRVAKGRVFRDRQAVDSEHGIILELMSQWPHSAILGAVRVEIKLRATRHDIINQAETLLDALQGGHTRKGKGLVIADDKQVTELVIKRAKKEDCGHAAEIRLCDSLEN